MALGLAGLLILVGPGGYALSMVGVDGSGIDNTKPPRVTLVLLGLVQAGVTGLFRHRLAGLAQRPAVSSASLLVNAHLMTIYLWHLTALGLTTAVSLWAGGFGLRARPDTEAWWWSRPVWLVVLAMVTADGTRWWLPLLATAPPMLLRRPRQSRNRMDAA